MLENFHDGDKRLQNLEAEYHALINGKSKDLKDDFDSENIVSIEENIGRSIIKKSKCMGKILQRNFEIFDEETFAYFTKKNDKKPKKELPMEEFKWRIQTKEELNEKEKKEWNKNKEAANERLRLEIGIRQKK